MYRFLIPAFGLTLFTGFFSGAVFDAWSFHPAPDVRIVADETPPTVPVVRIDGIHNGALVGSVSGNARLVAGARIILPAASGSFAISDSKLLTNMIEIHVPPGMRFVASKRGKKYYPVTSASAAGLSPANRVYFPSAQAAEKAGYKK